MGTDGELGGLRIIAVAMEKGGTGKTTLSMHLAIRAAQGGLGRPCRVLLIDIDGQQNASCTLLDMSMVEGTDVFMPPLHPAYDPENPDMEGWRGRSDSMDLYHGSPVLPYPTTVSEDLEVLPSDGHLNHRFVDEGSNEDEAEIVAARLRDFFATPEVIEKYDLVIVDCPPGRTSITAPLYRVATDVILPFEPKSYSVQGVNKVFNQIRDEDRYRDTPLNILGIIPNRVTPSVRDKEICDVARHEDTVWSGYVTPFDIPERSAYVLNELPVGPMKKLKHRKRDEQFMSQLMNHVAVQLGYGDK